MKKSYKISITNYNKLGYPVSGVSRVISDLTFSNVTLTAAGALIFNDSASGDPSVCVLNFGADKSASSGDFTVVFPAAAASTAIIRIA